MAFLTMDRVFGGVSFTMHLGGRTCSFRGTRITSGHGTSTVEVVHDGKAKLLLCIAEAFTFVGAVHDDEAFTTEG